MFFFLRVVLRSLSRQAGRRILIAVTIALSATVCVSMLGVAFDVGDKVKSELTSYGSNIVVRPKSEAVVAGLYGAAPTVAETTSPSSLIPEDDVTKIKTIFWAFNIIDMAPRLDVMASIVKGGHAESHSHASPQEHQHEHSTEHSHEHANHHQHDVHHHHHHHDDQHTSHEKHAAALKNGERVVVVGTWFHRHLHLPSGETTVLGLKGMRSWWKIQGQWAKDCMEDACQLQAMVGSELAKHMNIHTGDQITLGNPQHHTVSLTVSGIYTSGDEDDHAVYVPSVVAQMVSGLDSSLNQIEIKALTTPENDLAKKAARDPAALSKEEWETWYCTAYPSAIAYQIEEVLPGVVARQVRQVAVLQGKVLNKTQMIMIVMTVLSLLATAIAIANLMASSIAERSGELALLKALGATNGAVCRLMMSETAVITLVGAGIGAGIGSLVAQLIGHVVFHVGVTMRPMVFVVVAILLAFTVLLASFSAIRSVLGLHPAEVLHDR